MFNLLFQLVQPVGLFWLVLVVLTIWFLRRKQWRLAAFFGSIALLANLFGSDWLSAPLLGSMEKPYVRGSLTNLPTADAVVMLGGSHRASLHDTFGLDLTPAGDRIVTAVELMRLGKGSVLVLGGNGFQQKDAVTPESTLLKQMLDAWKIFPAPILELGPSANTREEALKTQALMKAKGWKRVLLVTSAFHMRRAEATFRQLGIEVIPVACDFQCHSGNEQSGERNTPQIIPVIEGFQHFGVYIREQGAWLVYRWRGWVAPAKE